MTPFTVVQHLAEVLRDGTNFTANTVRARLLETGVPAWSADQAFKFTQVAWGRALLQDLDLTLDPRYLCLDTAGRTLELGLLAEQPYFRAAVELIPHERQFPGFLWLARMSAEVMEVNDLLNAGSRAADLVPRPLTLIFDAPQPRKMPWWRFW